MNKHNNYYYLYHIFCIAANNRLCSFLQLFWLLVQWRSLLRSTLPWLVTIWRFLCLPLWLWKVAAGMWGGPPSWHGRAPSRRSSPVTLGGRQWTPSVERSLWEPSRWPTRGCTWCRATNPRWGPILPLLSWVGLNYHSKSRGNWLLLVYGPKWKKKREFYVFKGSSLS